MSHRLVNVSDTQTTLTVAATGQTAAFGEEIEVEDAELAEALKETGLWAAPTTKAAKSAAKEGD